MLALPACLAGAEDFKLSDGTVFRHVRVVEVRPDALVLMHDGGMAIANLAKFPKAIRTRYGYEPGKAAAFREREAIAREARLVEDRRLVAAHEQRRMELARQRMEASAALETPGPAFGETHFSYGVTVAPRSPASAEAFIAAEIEHHEELRMAAARAPDTFWTADFWKHPAVKIIGSLLGAGGGGGERSASEPRNWR